MMFAKLFSWLPPDDGLNPRQRKRIQDQRGAAYARRGAAAAAPAAATAAKAAAADGWAE